MSETEGQVVDETAPGPAAIGTMPGQETFAALESSVSSVVATTPGVIRLAVACLAAGGHLLVEDHPGLGKTTLAKALAASVALDFHRIQCTADLLPADVVGATVLGPDGSSPVFRPGPVFTNVLMADELNRASARAQSALLEAMEERQVTVDGTSHPLPDPFFVLATQNPHDTAGTAPLPHGQRDRFLVRLSLGYPERRQMAAMVDGSDPSMIVRSLGPATTRQAYDELRAAVAAAHRSAAVRDYVLDLGEATRRHGLVAVGASPRAVLALLQVSAALSVAGGRDDLSPDDVQQAAVPVLAHRLLLQPGADSSAEAAAAVVSEIVATTEVPVATRSRAH